MIEPHQVYHGGVEIMYMHRVFNDIVPEFIRLSIYPRPGPAPRHPDRKTAWMVVPAVVIHEKLALTIIRTAEFSSPDHQGLFQQASLFHTLDQHGGTLIYVFTLSFYFRRQIAM